MKDVQKVTFIKFHIPLLCYYYFLYCNICSWSTLALHFYLSEEGQKFIQ